jgi:hypothetical protein
MLPVRNDGSVQTARCDYGVLSREPSATRQFVARVHARPSRRYGVRRYLAARFGGRLGGTVDPRVQAQIQQAVYDAAGYSMRMQ